MNLFVLSDNYGYSAWLHPKKLAPKMVLEAGQVACSVIHVLAPELVEDCQPWIYKLSHKNHPTSIWARESKTNYIELLDRTKALYIETLKRNGGTNHHKTVVQYGRLNKLYEVADLIDWPQLGPTPYKLAFNASSGIDKSVYDGSRQHAIDLYRHYIKTKPYLTPEDNFSKVESSPGFYGQHRPTKKVIVNSIMNNVSLDFTSDISTLSDRDLGIKLVDFSKTLAGVVAKRSPKYANKIRVYPCYIREYQVALELVANSKHLFDGACVRCQQLDDEYCRRGLTYHKQWGMVKKLSKGF